MVVINSIPITSQLSVEHLRGIVEKDLRRAQKHCSPQTIAHGPRAVHEARNKCQPESGSGVSTGTGSQPASSNGQHVITVDDATVTYNMPCNIGGNDFNLLIDTGSSNTWCGANKSFQPSSSCVSTRKTVKVGYGSGSFEGTEYEGPVILGDSLKVDKQSFAVANTAQGFKGIDGILGIGPVSLTNQTVEGIDSIPTVTDNLFKQGTLDTECIGISYNPTSGGNGNLANGELCFGSKLDRTKIASEITYVPITTTSPASKYWGIDQSIAYGSGKKMMLEQCAGIVDTGTTLIMIPDDAFKAYQDSTGATPDQATGLLKLTPKQFENLESMYFNIGDTCFELTPNAQIWPRALNSALGGDSDSIYCVFANIGPVGTSGLSFINGFTWLQRFYSIFDTTNSRVGIATTPDTYAETN
ncbi:putative aspartic protease [Rhodocollybia butyracea]|uniref:Aspartic protease n=1 Tax=Rhodocollybia butyracea TaxID=206335 RepID=A0A9P5TZE7_9AGAR|nr:putative aspartic protease [Rhodocollybia butyracea]